MGIRHVNQYDFSVLVTLLIEVGHKNYKLKRIIYRVPSP